MSLRFLLHPISPVRNIPHCKFLFLVFCDITGVPFVHMQRKRGSSDGKGHSRSAGPHSSPSQRHFK